MKQTIVTIAAMLLMSSCIPALGQNRAPSSECGYQDTPPSYWEEGDCIVYQKGAKLLTDWTVEGSDTTRIREMVVPARARYRVIRYDWIPSNSACPVVVLRKRVRCK